MTPTTHDSALAIRGLHATRPQPLSFAPRTVIRTFQLERAQGNLLVYSSGPLAGAADELLARGGAERQYLGHWHEAMFGFAPPALGARLIHHEAETQHVAARGGHGATFTHGFGLGDDFEAIPIPGHTPGSTAYLWDNGDERLLFTADSLYLRGEEWVAAVLDSSDRAAYVDSLERLRELDFDVLVPWAASLDGPALARVTEDERRAKLDAVIARVRDGADA